MDTEHFHHDEVKDGRNATVAAPGPSEEYSDSEKKLVPVSDRKTKTLAESVSPFSHPVAFMALVLLLLGLLAAEVAHLRARKGWPRAPSVVTVPKRDLPQYHLLQADDLKQMAVLLHQVDADAVREPEAAAGRYALTGLQKDQPMLGGQLGPVVDPALLSRIVATPIPATPSVAPDAAEIKPGDSIDIVIAPAIAPCGPSNNISPSGATSVRLRSKLRSRTPKLLPVPPPTVRFKGLLVLNIEPAPANKPDGANNPDQQVTVIVGLPRERRLEFAALTAHGSLKILPKSSP